MSGPRERLDKRLSDASRVKVYQHVLSDPVAHHGKVRFFIRKRGERLTDAEQDLVDAAFKNDPKRYAALEGDVFDATVPFGSAARWKR